MQEYKPESLEFMEKIVKRSGIGPSSYMPDGVPAQLQRAFAFTRAGGGLCIVHRCSGLAV